MPRNQFGFNTSSIDEMLYGKQPKRTSIRTSDRKHLLEFQHGKCAKCKKSFKQMKVRTILHHKNLNPKDNRITNMILVCPNCHDKIHQREKKVRVRTTDQFGFSTHKVVKKTVRKKPTKKKTTKKKTTTLKKKSTRKKTTAKKKTKRKRKKTKSIWDVWE